MLLIRQLVFLKSSIIFKSCNNFVPRVSRVDFLHKFEHLGALLAGYESRSEYRLFQGKVQHYHVIRNDLHNAFFILVITN